MAVTMSSDEDFSLMMESPQPLEDTLEGITALTTTYKKSYEQLVQEQKELAACTADRRELTQQFKQRCVKLTQTLQEDQRSYKDQIGNEEARLNLMKQEEIDLMMEIQQVEAALKEEEAKNDHLKLQTDVFTTVPEKTVVFKGSTGKVTDAPTFVMNPRVIYPMEGGTALVTFEEEVVAKNILTMKKHQVELAEECTITMEARPVQLLLPKLVEIDTEVCPQRILISSLPRKITDNMLNKLEIHFSKRKNGGGEVDQCEMLPDSGTVVVTFVEENFARGLTDMEYHEVDLGPQHKKHRVRVTPFLNGKITNFKTKMSACARTVLLTDIPAIGMDQETLQDLLEIHFQKSSNGGGEIEAFLYNPLGQHTSALFEGVSPNGEEEK